MDWRLFTYNIRHDTGYAPNPFFGVCTLNTCKPQIRREANEGDWIVALKRDRVVCVMRITKKMTMAEYWHYCVRHLPEKIPPQTDRNGDPRRLVGDCQYDFSSGNAQILQGRHKPGQVQTDLSGKNALLSEHFVYFGNLEMRLPRELVPIAQYSNGNWIGQARKSSSNAPHRRAFLDWVTNLPCGDRVVLGQPTDNPIHDQKEQRRAPTSACNATARKPRRG